MNGFTELVIILTNPEGKKKVTEEAKCNTLKKIAIVTKTTEQNLGKITRACLKNHFRNLQAPL